MSNDFFDTIANGYALSARSSYKFTFYTNPNDAYMQNIKQIIHNPPATIIIWKNGNKSVVKCMDTDTYNPEQGIAMCLLKEMLSEDAYRELKKIMCETSTDFNTRKKMNNETEDKEDESKRQ